MRYWVNVSQCRKEKRISNGITFSNRRELSRIRHISQNAYKVFWESFINRNPLLHRYAVGDKPISALFKCAIIAFVAFDSVQMWRIAEQLYQLFPNIHCYASFSHSAMSRAVVATAYALH